jgi:hypothetical protein
MQFGEKKIPKPRRDAARKFIHRLHIKTLQEDTNVYPSEP